MKVLKTVTHAIQALLLKSLLILIRTYQLFLSPVLGSSCRFYPSCSHYCQEALHEHGIRHGLLLTVKRVCRCHPGHPGGFDPVPKKKS